MRASSFASFAILGVAAFFGAVSSCTCNGEPPAATCAVDDDCADDETCIDEVCKTAEPCSLDVPCSGKQFTCKENGNDGLCHFIHGGASVGDACSFDVNCDTGACVFGFCAAQCTLDDGCDGDLRCVLDGPRRVCVEATAANEDGAGCTDARDCASGTCVVPPTVDGSATPVCAPACDAAHACDGDNLCLPLEQGARACLPPVDDGAPCIGGGEVCAGGRCIVDRDDIAVCASACVADACDDGFLCVDDDAGGRICMPIRNEFDDGAACVDERDCLSRICAHYVADSLDANLCASPCPAEGCGPDRICWEGEVDLCGPIP